MAPSTRLTTADKASLLSEGPIGWRNWRAQELRTRSSGTFELLLYSDARFTDEVEFGPYTLFNLVSDARTDRSRSPAQLQLQVRQFGASYYERALRERGETASSYHGGWLGDELAALLSLSAGVRCQAGETVRWGNLPRVHGARPAPLPLRSPNELMLPDLPTTVDLKDVAAWFRRYPMLDAPAATRLTRAARQYQSALWVADADPNLAWLQLVSAIEAVAADRADVGSAWEVVRMADHDLAAELTQLPEINRDAIAELVAPSMRAAKRFRDFIGDHLPPAPERRPHPELQVKWTRRELKNAANVIYGHRSVALHQGIPFPAPLCWPILRREIDDDAVAPERDYALGAGSGDANWEGSELPMLLHVFFHVVRHALLNWWAQAAE